MIKRWVILGALLLTLGSCAAGQTAIEKRNLDVQTKMSDSIFLEPVSPDARSVFVEVKNVTDKRGLNLQQAIRQEISSRGYEVVDDPAQANFMLQANILQAGRNSDTAAEEAFNGGFGSILSGGAIGAAGGAVGGALGGNDTLLIAGGILLGAAVASVADAFVQDVTYSVIADLQVSERSPDGIVVARSESRDNRQGSSGQVRETSADTANWKRYRTRVVSKANKVNLEWPEAAPQMVAGLTSTIGGIF